MNVGGRFFGTSDASGGFIPRRGEREWHGDLGGV
jgi:hypothetical protein